MANATKTDAPTSVTYQTADLTYVIAKEDGHLRFELTLQPTHADYQAWADFSTAVASALVAAGYTVV